MRILVADDEPTSRLIAEVTLRTLGHECETVTDGAEAWDAFLSGQPDVVISDWLMPGMSGLELCKRIRNHKPGGYTYFILVTGQGGRKQIVEGMKAGADDYLLKPLDSDDLEARLIAAARVTALDRLLTEQRLELEELNSGLATLALRDQLTGLSNRRALDEDLAQLEERVLRYGHRYCIAVLDVDHFKSFNDTYGHQAGDEALKAVAARLKEEARGGDAVYRYGGEEFLCIFPEQSFDTATIAVERIRTGLERMRIPHTGASRGVLTISAGLAILDPDDVRAASAVLEEADAALYRAKQLGRNRIEQGLGVPAGPRALAIPGPGRV